MSSPVKAVLCAEEDCLAHPESLGLRCTDFNEYPWLVTMSSAQGARNALALMEEVREVWVASSDEVDGINLAAALKADNLSLCVRLIEHPLTESVRIRVKAAGLDGVLTKDEFAACFEAYDADWQTRDTCACRQEGESANTILVDDNVQSDIAHDEMENDGKPGRNLTRQGRIDVSHFGYLLTVVSGSGGVGKSTVSTLIAALSRRRGFRVALLDADLQFGDVHELVGSCCQICIDEVIPFEDALADAVDKEFVVVRAPRKLEHAEVAQGYLGEVTDVLLGQFDLVVVNTGGDWGERHMMLLERSTTALFLVDQRASSVRACRHALDLCLRCGIATSSFVVAVNRCARHAPFTSADVSSALQGVHVVEFSDGGSEVEELLASGLLEQLMDAGNPLCTSLVRFLEETVPIKNTSKSTKALSTGVVARFGLGGASAPKGRSRRREKHTMSHQNIQTQRKTDFASR